jgi:hypothetical protein
MGTPARRFGLVLASVLAVPGVGIAATDLPDTLWGETTLTPAGSPYRVTQDTFVPPGSVLIVLPGVTVRLVPNASLIIRGRLVSLGNEASPIVFEWDSPGVRWGAIGFHFAQGLNRLQWTTVRGAQGEWVGGINFAKALGLFSTELRIEDCLFERNRGCVHALDSDVVVRRTTFRDNSLADVLIAFDSTTLVEDSAFENIGYADAIEGVFTGSLTARRNRIDGTADDGIDVNGTALTTIEDNTILNAADKGISLGEGTVATAAGNVIAHCGIGIAVKLQAGISGSRNTLVDLATGLQLEEAGSGAGGGGIDLVDTILSGVSGSLVLMDDLSSLSLRYCLTGEAAPWPGDGNIAGDPRFVDPASDNYRLRSDSPCIDAGDPASPPDPDGTRADMGAFPFYQLRSVALNEALASNETSLADSAGEFDPWFEIATPSDLTVALDSFFVSDDPLIPDRWRFPAGSELAPGAFAVVWADGDTLQGGWHTSFLLDSGGGWIGLFRLEPEDPVPALVDSVTYAPAGADTSFGRYPDVTGPWFVMPTPTPGEPNLAELVGAPDGPRSGAPAPFLTVYPSLVEDACTIGFETPSPGRARLDLFDAWGRRVARLLDRRVGAGPERVVWRPVGSPWGRIAPGVYFVRLVTPSGSRSARLLILR